jgi:hypothetical protein
MLVFRNKHVSPTAILANIKREFNLWMAAGAKACECFDIGRVIWLVISYSQSCKNFLINRMGQSFCLYLKKNGTREIQSLLYMNPAIVPCKGPPVRHFIQYHCITICPTKLKHSES